MSTVAVMFLTYTPTMEHPRVGYARTCLSRLLDNLKYDGTLHYHVADDGSPPEHVEHLVRMVESAGYPVTYSSSGRMGYGGNYNLATQTLHQISDYVLPVEEDWELVREFRITPLVKALEESIELRCIRLGYLGWTNNLQGKLVQSAGQTFLLFDPDSPETHVFAGHPRLEKVEFEQYVGAWPEGIKAGYTEMAVCENPRSRIGIAWPLDADINASQDYCRLFAHIGESQA